MFSNKDYVYCIYKEKSFSKAADKLHISQPSLSATIAKVEKQLGMKIFERKTKPISLTPFGVEYIRGIERINEVEKYLQALAYDIHTLQSGSLAVGASNLSVSSFVPKTIAKFKELYPNIHVDLVDTSAVKSSHMLDTGDLDMVITNWPYDQNKYFRQKCSNEHLVLAVPSKYSINTKLQSKMLTLEELTSGISDELSGTEVSLSELEDIPFILLRHTSALRRCTDMMFKECQMEPRIVLETDYSAIAYNMASIGMGATIISNRLAIDHPGNSAICHYKLSSQYSTLNTYICYSKGRYLTPPMKKFIEMLQEDSK